MHATFLVACLTGFVGTVSAYGSSSYFGAYASGRLIPMTFLPTTGSSFATFEKCTDDSDWPAAGGTFNLSAGLEGCKTQCEDAYTDVGQAMYAPFTNVSSGVDGKCCCQAITMAQRSAASCILKVDDNNVEEDAVQSYLYKEYLPGSCDPWYDMCKHASASGGGWDQSCLQDVITAPEYTQGTPDTVGLEVSWEFLMDQSGASCSTTGTYVTLITGTEGSCTQHDMTFDNNGSPTTMTLYSAGYCDQSTDRGTLASFMTEAECTAWAAGSYISYNYSWSKDALFVLSGAQSATCEGDSESSFMMTCSNWCTSSTGDGWCDQWADAVNAAGKAIGTMILIIIISIVVVSILGGIGCWYCCCRNKGEQTVVVQGGQAGVPMAAPVTQAQPPGAVYMKNGVWLDKNDQPVAAQQV